MLNLRKHFKEKPTTSQMTLDKFRELIDPFIEKDDFLKVFEAIEKYLEVQDAPTKKQNSTLLALKRSYSKLSDDIIKGTLNNEQERTNSSKFVDSLILFLESKLPNEGNTVIQNKETGALIITHYHFKKPSPKVRQSPPINWKLFFMIAAVLAALTFLIVPYFYPCPMCMHRDELKTFIEQKYLPQLNELTSAQSISEQDAAFKAINSLFLSGADIQNDLEALATILPLDVSSGSDSLNHSIYFSNLLGYNFTQELKYCSSGEITSDKNAPSSIACAVFKRCVLYENEEHLIPPSKIEFLFAKEGGAWKISKIKAKN